MSRYAFVKEKKSTRRAHIRDIDDLLATWPKIVDYTGLSQYESKVYLSLLILGASGARKLSLHCRVPRTKVYGTLRKLMDIGARARIASKEGTHLFEDSFFSEEEILALLSMTLLDPERVIQDKGLESSRASE